MRVSPIEARQLPAALRVRMVGERVMGRERWKGRPEGRTSRETNLE